MEARSSRSVVRILTASYDSTVALTVTHEDAVALAVRYKHAVELTVCYENALVLTVKHKHAVVIMVAQKHTLVLTVSQGFCSTNGLSRAYCSANGRSREACCSTNGCSRALCGLVGSGAACNDALRDWSRVCRVERSRWPDPEPRRRKVPGGERGVCVRPGDLPQRAFSGTTVNGPAVTMSESQRLVCKYTGSLLSGQLG